MCVCVCVCVCARGARACVSACVRACVVSVCCFGGEDGCIPLIMLVAVCQCCCLLMFVCFTAFETLSLL